jgi:hypothetical protein
MHKQHLHRLYLKFVVFRQSYREKLLQAGKVIKFWYIFSDFMSTLKFFMY